MQRDKFVNKALDLLTDFMGKYRGEALSFLGKDTIKTHKFESIIHKRDGVSNLNSKNNNNKNFSNIRFLNKYFSNKNIPNIELSNDDVPNEYNKYIKLSA